MAMTEDERRRAKRDDEVRTAMEEKVHRRIGRDAVVDYSAYGEDAEGVPVDNLDEVAINGRVVFTSDPDPYWGGPQSRSYRSPVVESPTWLEVCLYANQMILATNDRHHCFLEGIKVLGKEGGVQVAEFSMGS